VATSLISSSPVDEYDDPTLSDFFSGFIDGITGGGNDENDENDDGAVDDNVFEVSEFTILDALLTECWMVP
jgi:hypothetical protein